MERIDKSKYSWFVSIFLIVLMSATNSHSAGFIVDWEPFQTKGDLGLYAVHVVPDKMLFLDEYTKTGNGSAFERDAAERRDDSPWNVFRFRHVSISFSHTVIDQIQKDVNNKAGDGSDKVQAIKALPSTFLISPYRDTFESVGKIFEPQINLSIEF